MKSCWAFILCVLVGIAASSQYKGGSGDGFHLTASANQNPLPNIYRGGVDDGFDMMIVAAQNPLPGIYLGGNNDGFTSITVFNQNPICTSDSAKWNGVVSIAWENPGNWHCGILPNINSKVIIPSGLARYPTVSFSFEIKSLYLQPGSSVIVLPGVILKLNSQ